MGDTDISLPVRPARVVVGVTGSPRSEAALQQAVQEARFSGRVLVPVLAWEPLGGETACRAAPEPTLDRLWERKAAQRMSAAVASALGSSLPGDLTVEPMVVHLPAPYTLTALAAQPELCSSWVRAAAGHWPALTAATSAALRSAEPSRPFSW